MRCVVLLVVGFVVVLVAECLMVGRRRAQSEIDRSGGCALNRVGFVGGRRQPRLWSDGDSSNCMRFAGDLYWVFVLYLILVLLFFILCVLRTGTINVRVGTDIKRNAAYANYMLAKHI